MRSARSAASRSHDPAFRAAANVTQQADRLRRQLRRSRHKAAITSPVAVPEADDSFPNAPAGPRGDGRRGLPLRCVALEATGEYDTHASQAAALAPALTTTAASLLAFQRDLEARGLADRVLTLVWSEFGRRAQENGSGGTDHGAAGTAFLIGTRAAGTHGRRVPGLATGLDADGNLQRDVATSAPSTRRCSSSGSASTQRASSRAPEVPTADSSSMRLAVCACRLSLRVAAARAPAARVQVVRARSSRTRFPART